MGLQLQWVVAIRDHPARPPALQRYVLVMLALRLDWSTGTGYASVRQLAADADACERTVKSATAWARRRDLLLLTRRGHRVSAEVVIASEWQLILPQSQGATGCTLGKANGQIAATQRARGAPPSRPVPPRPVLDASAGFTPERSRAAEAEDRAKIIASWPRQAKARTDLPLMQNSATPYAALCKRCGLAGHTRAECTA